MAEELEIKNAKITKVRLGYEDHGILTCFLDLDYGSLSQGFGGYTLDSYDEAKKERVGTAYGMEFLIRIMKVVGVENWEDLVGKHVRVKTEWTKIHELGNILEDRWFNPHALAEEMGIA